MGSEDVGQNGEWVPGKCSTTRRWQADLAERLQSRRKCAMSSLFLPVRQTSTSVCHCISTPVARLAALCVSPTQPDLADSYLSERAPPDIDHDRTAMAVRRVFDGNNTTVSGRSMAAPLTEGSSAPRRGGRSNTHTQNAWNYGFGQ